MLRAIGQGGEEPEKKGGRNEHTAASIVLYIVHSVQPIQHTRLLMACCTHIDHSSQRAASLDISSAQASPIGRCNRSSISARIAGLASACILFRFRKVGADLQRP